MRLARWLFIAFQFSWMNIALPGHTRGAITLPGAKASEHACCSAGRSDQSDPTPRQGQPTPSDRARCAICYFAVGISTPPPVLVAPTPNSFVELLPVPAPLDVEFAPQLLTYHGRAPPAA
jgi:hypothetical protein